MLLAHLRKPPGLEVRRHPDERRPQSPVYEGDVAIHETTDQDVRRVAELLQDGEDLPTPRVRPPAPRKRRPDDRLNQSRHGTFGRDQRRTVIVNEAQCLGGGHTRQRSGSAKSANMRATSSAVPAR